MTRLTLAEIAAVYKTNPRTFKKHVLADGIPYELLGRSMRFDPIAVSLHLAARPEPKQNVIKLSLPSRKKRSITVKSKFAQSCADLHR